jgi:hypothetical protein
MEIYVWEERMEEPKQHIMKTMRRNQINGTQNIT